MKFGSHISFMALLLNLVLSTNIAKGQGLEQFQWKNRILLLLSEEMSSEGLKHQLDLFEDQETELNERKLIIIQLTPREIKRFPKGEINGIVPQKSYTRFKRNDTPLEHVLIGLDGLVKLRGNDTITPKKLYGIIDAMPMRMAEQNKSR